MAEEEGGSLWGKMGTASAKYGAKVGKKFAQSEAGRAAGKAAVKGATKGATDELSSRYLGDVPSKESKPPASPAPSKKEEEKKKTAATTTRGGDSDDDEDGSGQPERSYNSSSRSRPPASTSGSGGGGGDGGGRRPRREDSPSFGRKVTDFSSRLKQATSSKIQDLKASREPRFSGPTQTPESAARKAEALLAKKRIKSAIASEADWGKLPMCEALCNFRGEMQCDLEFRRGQRIALICRTEQHPDWWEGRVNGKTGIFPSNYVRVL